MSDFNPDTDPNLNPEVQKIKGITAYVHVVSKWVHGGQQNIRNDKRVKQDVVVLRLDLVMSGQARKFWNIWMPSIEPVYDEQGNITQNHPPEVICTFNGPKVFGPCRMFVLLPDQTFNKGPYLFVGSVAVERMILRYCKEGDRIEFDCEGSLSDSDADMVSDPDDMTVDRVT